MAMSEVDEELDRWRKQGDQLKSKLQEKRAALVAQLADVDQALEQLGVAPAKRVYKARAPRPATDPPASDEEPEHGVKATEDVPSPPPGDEIARELHELRKYFPLLNGRDERIIRLRARGITPADIGKELRIDRSIIANVIFKQRTRLREARQAARQTGGKADRPSSDGEEPEPAGGFVPRATQSDREAGELVRVPPATSSQNIPPAPTADAYDLAIAAAPPLPSTPRIAPAAAVVDDAELDRLDVTPLGRIRRYRLQTKANGRVGSKTIAPSRLTRHEKRLGMLLAAPTDIERPIIRGDCEDDPGRPCPWVSCSHHLYLDVNPETGAIKLNFPHLEVWEMSETCSLDVADRGGVILEEVGRIINLTRERVRQVEVGGLDKIRDHTGHELGIPPDRAQSAFQE